MKFFALFLIINLPFNQTLTSANELPYFIAMEYKGMSNCIYKIIITDSLIIGAKVNGYISVEPNFGIGKSVPKDVMHSPEAYVDKKMEIKYSDPLSDVPGFLRADKDNFIIRRTDVIKVNYNPEKKIGMGYYPHTGRIIIETIKTAENHKPERELILVEDQDPQKILNMLNP